MVQAALPLIASVTVCGLAVLGVSDDGWKGPDRYRRILSSVIKIARFMVVQKALEMAGPDDEDEFGDNRPYDFENEEHRSNGRANQAAAGRQRKGCLQLVIEMMDKL